MRYGYYKLYHKDMYYNIIINDNFLYIYNSSNKKTYKINREHIVYSNQLFIFMNKYCPIFTKLDYKFKNV